MRGTDSGAVNASTTLVSDDTLTRAVEANSVYGFKIKLRYSSSVAAGLSIGMDVPAGASGDWVIPNTSSNVLVDIGTAITGAGHNSINRNMVIEGTVITGGTAGSMTLQFAQNASDASDTKLLAGSTLRVWKG